MSNINAQNIEERMFDYFEGGLSPEEMSGVEAFVAQNPQYQADFDAWKDSYFSEPEMTYPHADQLIAGSGGAWSRWAVLLLLLLGSGSMLAWYWQTQASGSTDQLSLISVATPHLPQQVKAQKTDQTSPQTNTDIDDVAATTNVGINGSESRSGDLHQTHHSATAGSAGSDIMLGSGESDTPETAGSTVRERAGKQPSGPNAENSRRDSAFGSRGNHFLNRSVTERAYSDPSAKATAYRFDFSMPVIDDQQDFALAQAVGYFTTNDHSGANNFSYGDPFPAVPLENEEHKGKARAGNSRIPHFPSNRKGPLGLRNFKDPYFLVPEYYSPLNHNSSFAGGVKGLRAKISGRAHWFKPGNHLYTGHLAVDGRIGKAFPIGIGFTGGTTYGQNDHLTVMSQEYGLYVSPKIPLKRQGNRHLITLEPSVKLTVGNMNSQFNTQASSVDFQLERGLVRRFVRRVESDTVNHSGHNFTYVDGGAGLLLNTPHFYAGVNIDNVFGGSTKSPYFTAPGMPGIPMSFSAVIGTDYKYSERSQASFSPQIMYTQTGKRTDLWAGAYANLGRFMVGGSYGNHGEFTGMLGLQTNLLRLTYSTDYTNSVMNDRKMLSHNIALRLFIIGSVPTRDLPGTGE